MNSFTTTVSVLEAVRGPGPDGAIHSYHEAFHELWALIDAVQSGRPWPAVLSGPCYVVWDDACDVTAPSQFPFANFLTAYDWVAALTIAIAERLDRDSALVPPSLRVHIFDCTLPAQWMESYSTRLSAGLPGLLPWVSIYRNTLAGRRHLLAALAPASAAPPETFESERWQEAADILKRLWTSELGRAGDRHSVSNAVGPVVLSQALAQAGFSDESSFQEDPPSDRNYFQRLLKLVGLLNFSEAQPGAASETRLGGLAADPFIAANLFGRFKELRFALVDDQASAGFHDVLAQFLLGPGQRQEERSDPPHPFSPVVESASKDKLLRLGSFNSPDILLAWLERAGRDRAERWYQPRVFGKVVEGTDEVDDLWQFDLLCLDLRLHGISGAQSQYDSEQTWLKKLLEFHGRHSKALERRDSGLNEGQRTALQIAVKAAEDRLKPGTGPLESSVAHVALLPILIAVCDPTVPIVLFSSTRQRAVLDLLRPFPNIDISFLKPSLTGYTEEDSSALNSAVESLRTAIHAGLRLHERRLLWELLYKFDLSKAVAPACILWELRNKGEPTLENATEDRADQTLPFSSAYKIHHQVLFEMMLECVLTGGRVEFLFRPHEFMESALLAEKRASKRYSTPMLKFWLPDILAIREISPSMCLRVEGANKLVVARNQYAHGYFVATDLSDEHLSIINVDVLLLLLFSVGDVELQRRITLIVEESNFGRLIFKDIVTYPVTLSDFEVQLANTARIIWSFLPTRGELVQRARGLAIAALQEGDVVEGTVTDLQDRYADIDIGSVSGRLHISEMSKEWVKRPSDILQLKQRVSVKVVYIDQKNQRISLSIKQL